MAVTSLIVWLIVLLFSSLIGLVVARRVFSLSSPESYFLHLVFGIAFLCSPLWLFGYLTPIPLTKEVCLIYLILITAVAAYLLKNDYKKVSWLRFTTVFLGVALAIVGLLLLRGYNPTVLDGEKPMDLMMLSSTMTAEHLPPEDSWLSGNPINYYYYGYFVFGTIGKISLADAAVTFNLGLVTLFVAIVVGLIGLGHSLSRSLLGGIFTGLSYGLVGNIAAIREVINHAGAFNWWSPSRAVEGSITEFPAFSYLFGDFHPHMMAHLWIVALLGLLLLAKKDIYQKLAPCLGIGIVLGSVYAVSSWSIVATSLVLLGYGIIIRPPLKNTALTMAAAGAVVLPYHLETTSIAEGIARSTTSTPVAEIFLHFGIFLPAVAYLLFVKRDNRFYVILGSAAILIVGPEIVVVMDYLGGRYNTIFKMYWDAWLLLSILSGLGLAYSLKNKHLTIFFAITGLYLVSFGYLALGIPQRLNHFGRYFGLDPKTQIYSILPEIREPYLIVSSDPKETRLYEQPGRSYSTDNLLSALTGKPTFLGWINHESLWRNNSEAVTSRLEISSQIVGCQVPLEVVSRYKLTYCYTNGTLTPLGR